MPLFVVIAATLAVATQPDNEPPITVIGRPWAPFISPMGEPFRASSANDDPLARWFHQADRNSDGMLTIDEMRADAERFFARLDRNSDRQIDPEEMALYESEVAQEVQVNTRWKRTAQAIAESRQKKSRDRGNGEGWRPDPGVDGYQVQGLQGAARYGLLNIPQPVAGADADFNRSTTFAEFRRAAEQRFELLDSKRLGYLAFQELEPLLPTRPKARKSTRPLKEPRDSRVGLPLPEGN